MLASTSSTAFSFRFWPPLSSASPVWPVYTRLLRQVGGNTTLGASIAIILILTFLVVPIFIAASYTASEIREWFGWAVHVNKVGAPVPD